MTAATGTLLPPQNPQGGESPQSQRKPDVLPASRGIPIRALAMPLALLAITLYFTIASRQFISPRNLSMLAIELSITAVLALGMLLVILPGHIDLSAGSGVALFGAIAAVLIFQHGWPAPLALLAATVAAVIVWLAMGSIIIRERVPAFIITLAGLLVFRGLQLLVIQNQTIPIVRGGQTNIFSLLTTYYLPPRWGLTALVVVVAMMAFMALMRFRTLKAAHAQIDGELIFMKTFVAIQLLTLFVLICNAYQGVPLPAIILACVAIVVYVLTQHMPFGRYLYAIGGNEEAAMVSGIPVKRVSIGAFVMMGLIVALTGFLQTAYQGSSSTTVGTLMELDAVAACVIGGTSLKGGRGSVGGVLMGALIMAALMNGMTLMAVSPEKKLIARGAVLALAVWADVRLSRR